MKLKSFKLVKQYHKHVDLTITNLTEFELTRTELKWVFCEQIKFSWKLANNWKRIWTQPTRKTLSELKSIIFPERHGPWLSTQILQGFISNFSPEGVSFVAGRQITIEWLGLDLGDRERCPGRNSVSGTVAPWPAWRNLAGVSRFDDWDHDSTK